MKRAMVCLSGIASMVAWGVPVVSNVQVSQEPNRKVTVTYELSVEPGIVTLDFETNTLADASGDWVRVGGGAVQNVFGDADRYVKTTGSKTAYWKPERGFGGFDIKAGCIRAVVTAWATNAPPDYMTADFEQFGVVSYYSDAEAVPGTVSNDVYKTSKLLMRKIPAAGVVWMMGSPEWESGFPFDQNEFCHRVTLSEDYYIGVYEVTRKQWSYCGLADPSVFTSPNREMMLPVHNVDYRNMRGDGKYYAQTGHKVGSSTFLGWCRLNLGVFVDLPSAAQWEFACRAGKGGAMYRGRFDRDNSETTIASQNEIAWGPSNASEGYAQAQVHEVGLKIPNDFGLYDMIGNVGEFVRDFYSNIYYSESEEIDPPGRSSCEIGDPWLAVRGGGYDMPWQRLRTAYLNACLPWSTADSIGFRLWAPAAAY